MAVESLHHHPATSSATTAVVIEPPAVRDMPALRRLFRQALRDDFQYFPPTYASQINHQNSLWRLLLAGLKADRIMRVAKVKGQIVGYSLGSLTPQHNGELYWLYVDPSQRTRNIGAALLQATLDTMKLRGSHKVTLVTYDLKDYYQRHGFYYRGKQHIHSLDLDVMEHGLGDHE
jgi:predicted N-acetyltransferase YhbS